MKDHPDQIRTHWIDPDGKHVPVGKMTGHASKRFGGFAPIYKQLTGMAHPSGRSVIHSHHMDQLCCPSVATTTCPPEGGREFGRIRRARPRRHGAQTHG